MVYKELKKDSISSYNDLRDNLMKRQRSEQERVWANSESPEQQNVCIICIYYIV